jgi:hypothetical protein
MLIPLHYFRELVKFHNDADFFGKAKAYREQLNKEDEEILLVAVRAITEDQ